MTCFRIDWSCICLDISREKLIKTLVGFCENEGMEFVSLEVWRSNEAAKKLYSKMGFEEVGERKDFYENPREDAILMTYKR